MDMIRKAIDRAPKKYQMLFNTLAELADDFDREHEIECKNNKKHQPISPAGKVRAYIIGYMRVLCPKALMIGE